MKKVLIIDDTKNIRLLLTKCLELEGYEVRQASGGKEGLELISAGHFDLIFLDIKLPEMSGTEVLRQLRAAGVQTPVIIITAYPTIRNAVECTRLGVVAYLQKPFTAERLRNTLQDLGETDALDPLGAAERALKAGDGVRAIGILGPALGADPGNAELYAMLSRAYELLGDGDSAEKFSQAAKLFGK